MSHFQQIEDMVLVRQIKVFYWYNLKKTSRPERLFLLIWHVSWEDYRIDRVNNTISSGLITTKKSTINVIELTLKDQITWQLLLGLHKYGLHLICGTKVRHQALTWLSFHAENLRIGELKHNKEETPQDDSSQHPQPHHLQYQLQVCQMLCQEEQELSEDPVTRVSNGVDYLLFWSVIILEPSQKNCCEGR